MPTPLTNDRWGYESNCFVCEASNASGLRIPFELSDDGTVVSASFQLGFAHSGAPALVHGGLSLALLDEAQAWACIAIADVWALTRSTQASFDGAVLIDTDYRVEAVVENVDERTVETVGRILDAQGVTVVASTSSFVVLGAVDPAQKALGLAAHHQHLLDPGQSSEPN